MNSQPTLSLPRRHHAEIFARDRYVVIQISDRLTRQPLHDITLTVAEADQLAHLLWSCGSEINMARKDAAHG